MSLQSQWEDRAQALNSHLDSGDQYQEKKAENSSAFPDTISLLHTGKMPAGRGLFTGLHILSEQSLVLPGLKIRELLELVGDRISES